MWRRLIVIAILALVIAMPIVWWQSFTARHIYLTATSPNKSWSVTVYHQNVPPYIKGVDVIVAVRDGMGNVVLERTIDNCDLLMDVYERYTEVNCENNIIRVGPKYPENKNDNGYWVLEKHQIGHRLK